MRLPAALQASFFDSLHKVFLSKRLHPATRQGAVAIVTQRLINFRRSVHHEWAILGHRLVEGAAGDQQKAAAISAGGHCQCIATAE